MAGFYNSLLTKIKYLKRVKYSLSRDFKRKKGSRVLKIVFFAALFIVLFLYFRNCNLSISSSEDSKGGFDAAIANYGKEIKILSVQFDLSKEYLMALIMLESSGRKDVPPRFEKGIYQKLKAIQEHSQASLENISYKDIADASDEALINLASSWGPFQLMGYKCLHLDVKIKDLRGANSLYWGVFWIDKTYGDYIRQARYGDAFHIHNTGRPIPKSGKHLTYDPDYVKKGLEYMEYFKNNF
jgi:hypothetical protein